MKFKKSIYNYFDTAKQFLAVLVDPDKYNPELIILANKLKITCFLVGGSVLETGDVTKTILHIKSISKIPVFLFPGSELQLSKHADGLLLLSLLSGNNPDYLIGKHIVAAPIIKRMKLDCLPTAYLLIESGSISTTQKITQTQPLKLNNTKTIINTALAAEQLGFKAIYLEAGSGAKSIIPVELIKKIKKQIKLPIIVGGGIDSKKKIQKLKSAGVNMIVVGNALEKNVFLLSELNTCF